MADPDAVWNLQWQTVAEARAKDAWERKAMSKADKMRRLIPPELQARIFRINFGGRSYELIANPDVTVDENLRQAMDDFRRIAPNLEEGAFNKVAEILRKQIEEIKAQDTPRRPASPT